MLDTQAYDHTETHGAKAHGIWRQRKGEWKERHMMLKGGRRASRRK
jgi:hypothetical protein